MWSAFSVRIASRRRPSTGTGSNRSAHQHRPEPGVAHPVAQILRRGRRDLAERILRRAREPGIGLRLHPARAEHQRLELLGREHQRRQEEAGLQHVADPRLAIDRRAEPDEGLDVAIQRAHRNALLLGKLLRRDRPAVPPQRVHDGKQPFGLVQVSTSSAPVLADVASSEATAVTVTGACCQEPSCATREWTAADFVFASAAAFSARFANTRQLRSVIFAPTIFSTLNCPMPLPSPASRMRCAPDVAQLHRALVRLEPRPARRLVERADPDIGRMILDRLRERVGPHHHLHLPRRCG